MKNRATEFWVGLFTLMGIGLALFMVYRTGDLRWNKEKGYMIAVNFRNVSGLDVGDTVRVAGVEAGQVEGIGLQHDLAHVTLLIKHDVALYEDATAEVKTMGLLGNQFISVDPGHARLPRVTPGGLIQSVQAEDNINVVMGKLSRVAGDIQAVSENMKKVFGGAEGQEAMRDVLENTRQLSDQLVRITRENREQFREITTHLAGVTGEVRQMVVENRAAIRETMAALPETADNLRRITGDTSKLLDEHYKDLSIMLKQLGVASVRLEVSLQNLEEVSRKIKEGEGSLGLLINDPSLYNEATNTMREARNLIEDLPEQAPISAFISLGGALF
jgi:phospholipid/cholesterol/gamma-HCH transport system substrate-binding protein